MTILFINPYNYNYNQIYPIQINFTTKEFEYIKNNFCGIVLSEIDKINEYNCDPDIIVYMSSIYSKFMIMFKTNIPRYFMLLKNYPIIMKVKLKVIN